jgi:hypothetical protein
MSDRRRVPENELSDSEDEGENRRNRRNYGERRSLLTHDRERNHLTDRNVTMEADDEAED